MSFEHPSQDAARKRCDELNATAWPNIEYRVELYPNGKSDRGTWKWGVASYRQYADRSDLGWFFNRFIWEEEKR